MSLVLFISISVMIICVIRLLFAIFEYDDGRRSSFKFYALLVATLIVEFIAGVSYVCTHWNI